MQNVKYAIKAAALTIGEVVLAFAFACAIAYVAGFHL